MALEKAVIVNIETGDRISVMFNPGEYTLSMSNSFAEIGIPGLQSPPLQFISGGLTNLKLDLFFDTWEKKIDVRDYTRKIAGLLEKDTSTHAPPVLLFTWGSFNFKCVLDSVSQKFTMFLDNGTPVRATLSVTFKEFIPVEIEIQRGFSIGPPMLQTLVSGQQLSDIAASTLGDPGAWREIAKLNNIDNPRTVPPGTVLSIPVGNKTKSPMEG